MCDSTVGKIAIQCRDKVSSWNKLNSSSIQVETLVGGCSNLLWKVSNSQNIEPQTVVYRKYCPSTIVDRETEAMVIGLLNGQGLTVQVYFDSEEFRIEDFIIGSHPSTDCIFTEDLLKVMAQIHSYKNDQVSPIAFRRLDHFMKLAEKVLDKDSATVLDQFRDTERIWTEINWLREKLENLGFAKGLCHNDLHALNILQCEPTSRILRSDSEEESGSSCEFYQKNDNSLVLIDFEFADYNYLACEWANSFYECCMNNAYEEWPHFQADDSKWPSREKQTEFVSRYLFHLNGAEPSNEELDNFLAQIEICLLVQHLTWALWSLPSYSSNAESHAIDWGYAEYGVHRLNCYYDLKEKLLSDSSCILNIEN